MSLIMHPHDFFFFMRGIGIIVRFLCARLLLTHYLTHVTSLRWSKSSEDFSHGLTVGVLGVAPLADTMSIVRRLRWTLLIFLRFPFCLGLSALLLVGKGDSQHADIPCISISKLPELV